MSGYAVSDLLSNLQILGEISTIDLPGTSLQQIFGWNIASFATPNVTGNVEDSAIREGQYDIFDVSRRVAPASTPGTAMNVNKPQKVGQTRFVIPRASMKVPLTYEEMNQRRAPGTMPGMLDRNVDRWIQGQTRFVAQQFANLLEFQAASLLRGEYSYTQVGDKLEHSFGAGDVSIDFQIPAGNKDQLDVFGTGAIIGASWATATTDIPAHLYAIHRAMLQQSGMGLEHVVLKSGMWNNVINNNFVKAQSGTSNTPFESLNRVAPGKFMAKLRDIPWLTFHIVDYGLEVWDGSDHTYTELIEDDHAAFLPQPTEDWVGYIRGMETVVEGENGPVSDQYGFYPYAFPSHDPSGWNIAAVHNGLPKLVRPKTMFYADLTP